MKLLKILHVDKHIIKQKAKPAVQKIEKPPTQSALKEQLKERPKGPVKTGRIKPKLITEQFEGKLFADKSID